MRKRRLGVDQSDHERQGVRQQRLARRGRGRLRGGRGDLPGSRGALASGAHYPATGHPGGA
jgi:hypothetical protein